ncbi:MAG: hypothetical protein HXX10_19085 [Rhodoplanes sp.]|uniref:hypothetical protein n=1 Tax=Rhodoplanes sp. TaxID=1968906 RepID=UPI0017E596AE|nr:hypothetical protein [Rhodoplanes sp.]NVO16143.1 hypothetical protein [Rhodoplanes sp.]
MVRSVRQIIAVLVALAWMIGNVLPVVPADASAATALASTAPQDHGSVPGAADAMPCHHDGTVPDTGSPDKTKPCPVVALCAKCFQALPTVAAPIARFAFVTASVAGTSDQQVESIAPPPLLKPPRV